jgi:L,D-transpeptidase YcbB
MMRMHLPIFALQPCALAAGLAISLMNGVVCAAPNDPPPLQMQAQVAPAKLPVARPVQAAAAQGPATRDPVSGALEMLLSSGSASGDRKTIAAFYAKRTFGPLWVADGRLNAPARAVIHRLERADAYGLDPARYATPLLDIGLGTPAGPEDLAAAELAMTAAALKFAVDAQVGTFDPETLGKLMTARPVRPDSRAVLDGLAAAADPVAYLVSFNPPQPAFSALVDLLAKVRARDPAEAPPEIGEGPSIKPGMSDERMPVLRERLGVPAIDGETAVIYDPATIALVEEFQKRAGLEVDGVVGPQTRAALNGGAEVSVADLLVNMERWRWVPRTMGALNVWVNIPEYRLHVMGDGQPIFETRVIVGTAENQTPIFSDEIEYVDVNPYWNVPRSIAAKEMMPEIRSDPSFFYRRGLEVIYTGGGQEVLIDPYSVDWALWDGETMPFRFRQPPGGENALGRVKFMFPNQHAVYLHDTPTRGLFAKSVRAFSHGCVRVDQPVAFADALLSREDQLNGERIKQLIGGGANGTLPLKRHVPVHLTYFTVWVDSGGEVQKRPDIYGYDARMKAGMGLGT